MKILGIDPGLADLGYGVIQYDERERRALHLDHGVVRTARGEPTARRLQQIYRELLRVIRRFSPDEVAIEELFFAANVKTAIPVAQARGVAILATAEADLPLAEYSPPLIKQALVGYGRADKRQVQMMVRAVLRLEHVPRPDHAADALAVAICHLHRKGPLWALVGASSVDASAAGEPNPAKELLAQQRPRRRRRSLRAS